MSDAAHAWAHETATQLRATLDSVTLPTEAIDVGDRGAALLYRDEPFFAVVLAAASAGPTRVTVTTGVFRDLDSSLVWKALGAANAFHRTRAQGRLAVVETQTHGVTITLHMTMGPAVLTNVPPFTQALLQAFTGEATVARKFLADCGVSGKFFRCESPADVAAVLQTVDDQTELLLDFDDIMRWR